MATKRVNITVNATTKETAMSIVARQIRADRKDARVVGGHLSGNQKPDSEVALYQVATGKRTWIVYVEKAVRT